MEAIEEPVTLSNKDQTQTIIKGKRTKRQRLPSPLRLPAMPTTSSRTSTDNNSGGFDIPTASSTTSAELRDSTEEEEDMANCLILLAQGHARKPMASSDNDNRSGTSRFIYECKTCNRCFPSFQALGGHRASHKKPKTNEEENKKKAVTYLNEENDHSHHDSTTSTDLSLQISNRSALLNPNTNTKTKVHECAICGAEFSSGQALGGHMRRHRTIKASASAAGNGSAESQEVKKSRNVLKLDLNMPAPEDDHGSETKFPFHQSKEKVIVFSATSLVDCHY